MQGTAAPRGRSARSLPHHALAAISAGRRGSGHAAEIGLIGNAGGARLLHRMGMVVVLVLDVRPAGAAGGHGVEADERRAHPSRAAVPALQASIVSYSFGA